MVDVGSIFTIKNLVYKDSGCIDYVGKKTPMLIIHSNDEFYYLLKLSASSSNLKCRKNKYIFKNSNGKNNFADLFHIYKSKVCWRTELDKIDGEELNNILNKFLLIQELYPDEYFPEVEEGIKMTLNRLKTTNCKSK